MCEEWGGEACKSFGFKELIVVRAFDGIATEEHSDQLLDVSWYRGRSCGFCRVSILVRKWDPTVRTFYLVQQLYMVVGAERRPAYRHLIQYGTD